MKMERQRDKLGHANPKVRVDGKAFVGGHHDDDDDSASTETPLASSGSDDRSSDAEGPAWARGNTLDETTGVCCSVNITTSFVPHVVRSRTQLQDPKGVPHYFAGNWYCASERTFD